MVKKRYIKGYQPSYTTLLTQVSTEVVRAKMSSGRDPNHVWDYAEALDGLYIIMPVEVKRKITRLLGKQGIVFKTINELAMTIYGECKSKIDKEKPRAFWLDKKNACMREVKAVLDIVFDELFQAADEAGLWLVVSEVELGGEIQRTS